MKKPSIALTLEQIRNEIRLAEKNSGRTENSVTLLAVSKTKPAEMVRQAVAAGQLDFGENYLDDALTKIDELAGKGCVWHFIGAIQSNKTKQIATHFDWVHSIDRTRIARRLSDQRPPGREPLNCCIQLNIDAESTKAGVAPDEVVQLCEQIEALPNLRLRGFMVIPATRTEFEQQRAVFAKVHKLYAEHQSRWPTIDTLSMGMSGDMQAAIAEGSTMVRIGTALFGERREKLK